MRLAGSAAISVCVCVRLSTLLRMHVITGFPRSVMKMMESTRAVCLYKLVAS